MGKHSKKALSVMLSGLLATSMFAALPAAASAAEGSGSDAGLSAGQISELTTQDAAIPADFDLRDRGVVTPVKLQDPWGSCWAFGSIAAAETSILSKLKEKGRGADAKEFDLSEKHLIWFGSIPATKAVDPEQEGEGMFVTGKEKPGSGEYTNAIFDNGGYGINTSTLFASGVGPVYEKYFPYRGDSGLTERQYLESHPKAFEEVAVETSKGMTGMTPEETLKNLNDPAVGVALQVLRKTGCLTEPDDSKLTLALLDQAFVKLYMENNSVDNHYTKRDDWTIPEVTTIDGQEALSRNLTFGFTMVDGNELPSLSNKDANGKWKSVNWDGVAAVKSELMEGHGVSAGFKADQAEPGTVAPERYMSTKTWAHYTYEDMGTSHMICIVGWSDSYPASNFLEGHQPPANGAWLVKNSWGSETDYKVNEKGAHIGESAWGIEDKDGKHTGYFWISYYDKSLNYCESMSFDTDLADAEGEMVTRMYDYMPSLVGVRTGEDTSEQSESPMRTANVFKNDTGAYAQLASVSTKTASPNATVKYSIYRLNKNAKGPEDGELIGTKTATYDYAGFHREKLDDPIVLKAGESFAVVAEETVKQGGKKLYEYAVNAAYTKEHAEAVKAEEAAKGVSSDDRDRNADEYGVAVVNEGESFIYEGGKWTDWTKYTPRTKLAIGYSIDNFSIKAYLVTKKDIADCTISGAKAKTFNGKKQTQDVTVKDGDTTLKEGTDYTVSYKDNKNAGKATMTVAGKGAYAGEAAKAFTIKKAANPMAVKGKALAAPAGKATNYARSSALKLSTAKGAVTFEKTSGNARVAVNPKTGTLTVKAGLKAGKAYKVKVRVSAAGGKNYKKAAKTAMVTVRAAAKGANPLTAKGRTVTASAKKATSLTRPKAFKLTRAKGPLTFKKVSGPKKVAVNARTGKVTVKAGLKAGKTYKVKVKVTAAGSKYYKKATKTVTVTVKVK